MRKYVVVKMLESLTVGDVFLSGQWPLYVTIVPNFEIDWDEKRLTSEIENILAVHRSFIVKVQDDDWFGPNKDVLVTRLDLTLELADIHNKLVDMLERNGAVFELPIILKGNYKPHATVQYAKRVKKGDALSIDQLTIVDKEPDGNPEKRRVLAEIRLK